MAPDDATLARAIQIARIALAFGRVERATRHEDGVRPETDTDHTVMLGLLAYDLAPEGMDAHLVASFALVHDLAEVYAGDEQTLTISLEAREAKHAREGRARERLAAELGGDSRIAKLLRRYEAQREPEARFVRLLDKVLPKLTHALNGCAGALPLVDEAGFVRAHERQLRQLQGEYPELHDALGLLRASMLHAESCWPSPQTLRPAPLDPAAELARLRGERDAAIARADRAEVAHSTLLRAARESLAALDACEAALESSNDPDDPFCSGPIANERETLGRLRALVGEGA